MTWSRFFRVCCLLALQGLVVFALSGCGRESAKKENGGDGSDADQKKEIKFDMSYLEKKWGIKYKSHSFEDIVVRNKGPNAKDQTVKELRILLEFTKDVDNLRELVRAFTPDPPIQLWFEFFDKENVSLGKHFPQIMLGSKLWKKGDVFEVSLDHIPKARKIEARPGDAEKDKSGSSEKGKPGNLDKK